MTSRYRREGSKIEWRRKGSLCGYVLADPFEDLLRSLSPEYCERAYSKICARVEEQGHDSDKLYFGWLHSGVAHLERKQLSPDGDRLIYSPTAYLGWFWWNLRTQKRSGWRLPTRLSERRAIALAKGLSDESPRLVYGSSYRSMLPVEKPQSSESIVEVIIDSALDEVSDWMPAEMPEGTGSDSILAEIVSAYAGDDEALLAQILDKAKTVYSADGYRLIAGGAELWRKHHGLKG